MPGGVSGGRWVGGGASEDGARGLRVAGRAARTGGRPVQGGHLGPGVRVASPAALALQGLPRPRRPPRRARPLANRHRQRCWGGSWEDRGSAAAGQDLRKVGRRHPPRGEIRRGVHARPCHRRGDRRDRGDRARLLLASRRHVGLLGQAGGRSGNEAASEHRGRVHPRRGLHGAGRPRQGRGQGVGRGGRGGHQVRARRRHRRGGQPRGASGESTRKARQRKSGGGRRATQTDATGRGAVSCPASFEVIMCLGATRSIF
mmetsp:Transcript_310/g.694  ORF Transcript_310/g.694 Transcript_310/m.694 type:complete len:259 (+) Transcript_310:462-1238(+)